MAENINALILPIGADPSQFQKSINDVKAAYKELSNTIASTPFNLVTGEQKTLLSQYGETIKTLTNDVKQFGAALGPPANSIAGLDKKIKELNSRKINLDAKTSASEIARLTKEIEKLTNQRNNIDALGASVQKIGQGAGNSFKKLEDSSKGGRIALTSLSLVAQDLPFGFIAIQNNLPSVIQSFGQLSTQSGGLKKALSAIGPLLLGPAGLFLAFSIVTSAVTFAVQKYGSLGAALDAIIGKQSKYSELLLEANKSYEKFNKEKRDSIQISNEEVASIQGTISKVTSLASIVTDLTKSYNERNSALNDLKSLDKERFGNLDIEKTKLEDLTSALDNYISSLKLAAVTKGFESAIGQTSVELAKQVKILNTLKDELADAKAAPVRFIGKADQIDTRDIDAATARIKEQDKVVIALRNDIALYNKEIDTTVKLQNSLQAPIDAANKALKDAANLAKGDTSKSESFKFEIEPLVDILSLEQKISLLERLGTVILDTKSKESERIQALKELSDLEYDVFGGIKLQNLTYNQLRSTLTGLGKTYQSLILQERQRVESLRLVDEAIKRQTYLNQVDRDEFVRNYKEKRQEINKTAVSIPKQITVPIDFFINTENLKKLAQSAEVGIAFGKEQKDIKDREEKYLASVKKIGNAVETGLQKPFRDFFDTLIDEGKFTFDSFADFAKDAFKRILAQLAAAGIARLVTTILTGGIPVPVIGSSRIQEPKFGGVGGGPLQIAGAVNLQLRGSDLVGSINRTNSTINRVG